MSRILILGSPGAGKTWLSNRLGELLGLEVIHLDDYYWQAGWTCPDDAQWKITLSRLLKKDSYIMDGNYSESLEERLKYADFAVYIDRGLFGCLLGYLRRHLTNLRTGGSQLPVSIRSESRARLSEKGFLSFCCYIVQYHLFKRRNVIRLLKRQSRAVALFVKSSQSVPEEFIRLNS